MERRRITSLYEDSTHRIWKLATAEGTMVLKVCDSERLTDSFFWRSMSSFFGLNLPEQLGQYDFVYRLVSELSPLNIPELIMAGASNVDSDQPAFLLTDFLAGEMVLPADVDDQMVIALADHLARLHQWQQNIWGGMAGATFTAQQWPIRLQKTLWLLSEQRGIIDSVDTEIIDQALFCKPKVFVPIMPDLRWDQFLQEQGRLTALVDLDAFVWGARELDFVLLEYLLSEEQSKLFIHIYTQHHQTIPELDQLRKPYRLLLFLMNVLGEKKLATWMSSATKF